MRAVVVTTFGGPEVLQVVDLPDPVAAPGQVVVRIRAICVNPCDLGARTGDLPGPPLDPPYLPGWDIAGEVVEVGEGIEGLRLGDRVAGMIPWYLTRGAPGGYAELVAADPGWLVPVPDGLDATLAATVPLNASTARQALELLALPAPSTVLVTGASGAVGGFAAQLAARAGHQVFAVSGHGDEDWVRGLGVEKVLPRGADLAAIGPVSAVIDAVPVDRPAAAAVADGGKVVTTRPTTPIDPGRGVEQQVILVHLDQPALRELVQDVADGRLLTRVSATLPLVEAAEAHRRLEAGGLRGKLVLIP